MLDQFSRTELLLGREGVERLARAHVAVFGLGGVGGYAAEALVRSGVGALDLIDSDRVSLTNLNRQILATHRTLGQYKADAARERALEINPEARVTARRVFYGPDTAGDFDFSQYDYVIDAIDTVAPKVALLIHCLRCGIGVISSMGAGGRTDPTRVRYLDISETRDDGLARAVRQRLRKAGMTHPLTVVASSEPPHSASVIRLDERNKRSSFGTTAAVPATFGICLANFVVMRIACAEK